MCSGAISGDESVPDCRRERGGEHHDRHTVGTQPLQDARQVDPHVGVVGVDLVDHHNLAGHAQVAKHHVARLKCEEQQLVDRADGELRER
jgi:hypothetical protein